ncbi:ATP-dependent zinc metalloprotease FTSH 3, mitochondrial-like [Panicum miliaceum]|uniref:ATP-dependent zinc metalloprotease FTSH 3, mitochondrial-like n=1 Tax=Panicum miliaceum TaxID=4540 RepID=A0A3L6SMN2_PANMI|nr:ATP-dependent zinc metalloprotease FTSH 3, mitochondrial-like [Panicum miliaceum]
MSLSSLSRALRPAAGSLLEGYAGLRASPLLSMPGGDVGGLRFVRSYLTSALGSRVAAPTGQGKVGDWRFVLANSQFRWLFSDGSNKNYEKYHPKEKQEEPKGGGSDKPDPKWNFKEDVIKKFQEPLAPLLFLGLMLATLPQGSSAVEGITLAVLHRQAGSQDYRLTGFQLGCRRLREKGGDIQESNRMQACKGDSSGCANHPDLNSKTALESM